MTYHPEQGDLLAASRLHHLAAVLSRRTVIYTCVVVPAFGAIVDFAERPHRDALALGATFAALMLTAIVATLTLKHFLLPLYVVRRQLREQRGLEGAWTITWTERGYAVRGETIASETSWSHYVRWRENERVILLYQNWQAYQFVPKRVLPPGAAEMMRARLDAVGVGRDRLFLS